MAPRTTYSTLADGLNPLSLWDQSLADMGNLGVIPCTAVGANSIVLTPLVAAFAPNVAIPNSLQAFSFVAAGNSSAPVTVQIGTQGAKPLYRMDGVTQATTSDLKSSVLYFIGQTSSGFQILAPVSNEINPIITGATISGSTISTSTITVADNVFTLQDDGDTTKQARFQLSGITTGNLRTYSMPDSDQTLVGRTTTDTLTTKTLDNSNTVTLKDTLFTLQDDGDATKQAQFQLSGITTGNLRTFTLIDVNDTLVGIGAGQTLTNKTINGASNTLTVRLANDISGFGTNVAAALGNTLNAASGVVGFSGALGTPASGTLTNATGLPISTGVSGLGSGVATLLATFSSANLLSALTVKTGTGNAVFNTSPQMVTPDIIGTTAGGNANAGSLGEYPSSIIASGSAVSMTTATPVNIATITLSAGDWDVWAMTNFITAASTNITQLLASVSLASATTVLLGDRAAFTTYAAAGIVPGVNNCGIPMIQCRINVSGSQQIWLVGQPSFTVSTLTAWGSLQARRVR